jgi:NTE family protein
MAASTRRSGRESASIDEARSFLRDVPMFAELDRRVLDELAGEARSLLVPCDEYLFHQGDSAGWMAIVRTGRLEVRFETDDGETLAGIARRGAVLGELSLLTGTRRSASVRAVRDSELITIRTDVFGHLLDREPTFATAVARNLGRRLQASVDLAPEITPATVYALVADDEDVPFGPVADALAAALGAWGRVARVAPPSPDGERSTGTPFSRVLESAEHDHVFTVLLVPHRCDADWRSFCVRSADRVVVLVGRGGTMRSASGHVAELVGCELAFVDAPGTAVSMRAALETFQPRAHHLLGTGRLAVDVGRLARRLTGRSVGLVLSGGGARGLAHIGAVERLLDAGVQVDAVGGCSMGAFVGAMFALGWEPPRVLAACRAELVDRHPFNDYTLPRVALIRARKAREMLVRVFGTVSLEALDCSTFVVSADLGTGELVVHTRGRVAEAVGASMSIPGLVPPLRLGGRLLVDGGLLDNLPVDVMARRGEGPVIAVDVMRRLDAPRTRRSGFGSAPPIVETLTRATFLGGHERAASNRELADAVIAPVVADIGLLQFDRIDRAVAAGRAAADRALDGGLADALGRR